MPRERHPVLCTFKYDDMTDRGHPLWQYCFLYLKEGDYCHHDGQFYIMISLPLGHHLLIHKQYSSIESCLEMHWGWKRGNWVDEVSQTGRRMDMSGCWARWCVIIKLVFSSSIWAKEVWVARVAKRFCGVSFVTWHDQIQLLMRWQINSGVSVREHSMRTGTGNAIDCCFSLQHPPATFSLTDWGHKRICW